MNELEEDVLSDVNVSPSDMDNKDSFLDLSYTPVNRSYPSVDLCRFLGLTVR